MFRWEVEGKMDSLVNLFDDKLVIINSSGATRTKTEYLNDLKAGTPVHNRIDVQQSSASIIGTTAIVWGKGEFMVSINENRSTFNLSYMEVFVKQDKNWETHCFARQPFVKLAGCSMSLVFTSAKNFNHEKTNIR